MVRCNCRQEWGSALWGSETCIGVTACRADPHWAVAHRGDHHPQFVAFFPLVNRIFNLPPLLILKDFPSPAKCVSCVEDHLIQSLIKKGRHQYIGA